MDNNEINRIIGENIKLVRKKAHFTQEELSEKIDANSQFLSRVENGNVGISIDNVIKICNATGCSATEIFDGIINSSKAIYNYELLNEKNKLVIDKIIAVLLETE